MEVKMKKLFIFLCVIAFLLTFIGPAGANTIASSTMWFEGALTSSGGGYTGILNMINENAAGQGDNIAGYDVYGKNGANAWFGNDPGSGPVWTSQAIAGHDAWPTWNPDTPDWYQYSINFYVDGGQQKWAVRNHPGATAANPWYDAAYWGSALPAAGVPMSGTMNWTTLFAAETDVGAYLAGTGTAEIPGGAASKGGGAGAWDMDWSWGSEMVPLEYPGFQFTWETDLGGGNWRISLTPAPIPGAVWLLGSGLLGLIGIRRRLRK
jgi:hypothetical protein